MILGVSGDAASFSEQAALLYAKNTNLNVTLKYLIDMEGVLYDIAHRRIDVGILPVVNLRGGLVRMAFDAMGNHKFKVIDELWLDVSQCLLVKPGIQLSQITQVVTHAQAIRQCKNYLETHLKNTEWIEWQDTALAAKELSQGKLDATCAVIASEAAAHRYGLAILAHNIQDIKPNLTAFIIVKAHGDI